MVLPDLARDLRHACRLLRRSPTFTIVVVATLAVAIGASVTTFSILDSFLLRPLNFPRADRLAVGLYAARERPTEPAVFVLYRDYLSRHTVVALSLLSCPLPCVFSG